MTLDQQLHEASNEIHQAVAGRSGHPVTGVVRHRHLARLGVVATAAAVTLVTIGLSSAILRSDPAGLDVGAGETATPTTVLEPTPLTTVAQTQPTTTPVVPVVPLGDLPRFTIGLDEWFMEDAAGVGLGVFTHFEIADPPPLAHMADIAVYRNNELLVPFTSYEEHLAAAHAEGESLGTVTFDSGVAAEAFYFPYPGLYHDFMWRHSDSVWVVARVHTSTYGEAHRDEAFEEAKRIAGSIEQVSSEVWRDLVAGSPGGYRETEIDYAAEPGDPKRQPGIGKHDTPETIAWGNWVTTAMRDIGFEVDWIDVTELEGNNAGRIHARVVNPENDDWLLGYWPWSPGDYSDDIDDMYARWRIDEDTLGTAVVEGDLTITTTSQDTPYGTLITKVMRLDEAQQPHLVSVRLWMEEGEVAINGSRGIESLLPLLDPDAIGRLALDAAPVVQELLTTRAAESTG